MPSFINQRGYPFLNLVVVEPNKCSIWTYIPNVNALILLTEVLKIQDVEKASVRLYESLSISNVLGLVSHIV